MRNATQLAIAAALASATVATSATLPSITFTADGRAAVRLHLEKPRAASGACDWESLKATPVDLETRRGDGQRARAWRFNPSVDEATFATMDDLARWQETLAKRFRRDPAKTPLRIEARGRGDRFDLYANGAFLITTPGGPAPRFSADKDFPLALELLTTRPDPRFETVDITDRANASGMAGRAAKSAAPGSTVTVGGVPFLLSRDPRFDNVDLSMSWNPGAFRTGYSACHARKRWPDPLAKTPLRYQFRAPADDYDRLYVLCAADASKKDAIPRFTAQFHRWRNSYSGCGRPFNFASGEIPAPAEDGSLFVAEIPLSGDLATEFGNEEAFNFELTKDVFPYRTYADPLNHSWHAGGLPSRVRVYGVTLRRSPVKCRFEPLEKANIFEEGETVGYAVTLENATDAPRTEEVRLAAKDWYGEDAPAASASVALAPGETRRVELRLDAKRSGWYAATMEAAGRVWTHNFVRLRKRERGVRPFDEPCIRAGTWNMTGNPLYAYINGKGGWDTCWRAQTYKPTSPEDAAAFEEVMRRYGMVSFAAPGNIRAQNGITAETPPAEAAALYRSKMPDPAKNPETEFSLHRYVAALAEPGGIGTGNAEFPEWYGEPENAYDWRKLEGVAKSRYETYKRQILTAREVLDDMYPGAKKLIPHGSWNFLIPFLQDPETRFAADGLQMDFQFYTRLPEEQIHQTSLNSILFLKDAWRKFRPGSEPFMVWGEGPDVTQVYPGGSSQISAASHRVRISMLMAAYGCNIQTSWGTNPVTHGENHCSGGLVTGNNALDPDLHYAAFSAWLRHARHATHESFTFPGSTSAFCQNFRDRKTGSMIRAVWTVRGERDFIFDRAPESLTVYDPMDNVVAARPVDGGGAAVRAGEMPFFVYGAEGAAVSLGEPDNSDACRPQLGRDLYRADAPVVALGYFGDLAPAQCADADAPYAEMMPSHVKRFRAEMDVRPATDPGRPGAALVSVGLPPQSVDRMVMPYFTCLKFPSPVAIPGKAAALRLDVKAASDWGRVVFVLKDAAGRRWYSCGMKGEWNADDMEGDSVFCFDGWRTLRVELPSNEPWDGYRNTGFTNWGSDDLKAKVRFPLAVEKVFVERRSGVVYGCGFRKFGKDTPVLLGRLAAEYADAADATPDAYRLQNVAAPKVPDAALPNPIADLAKAGTLPAGRITGVKDPDTWFDGTRGVFSFEAPGEFAEADVWIAPHEDGRGALRLGKSLKSSPSQVAGFLAGQRFWAFLVWRDKSGAASVPSAPFPFTMEDHFGHQ